VSAASATAVTVFSFLLAGLQIAFGRYEFFPNIPLVFAFCRGVSRPKRTLLPVVACGLVMDVLSWGRIGPHTFSLIAVFFAAMKVSQSFDLLRPALFSASLFVCSNVAFAVISVSHFMLSGSGLETPASTALAQALSGTVAGTLFRFANFAGRRNERA